MKKTSKPTPKPAKKPAPKKGKSIFSVLAEPMDDRPMRYIIAGAVILFFGIFYFYQNLFEAAGFNDFGEYYLRAQDWANGQFTNPGGSDILLSVIEYFGILAHPHDFVASYQFAGNLLIVILLSACFLFVVRRNAAMPDFWIKLSAVALALSIPHFIFATITIDPSLLFAACILFVLATYNLPWAGFVGVIAFFSRPEAVIIVPLYLFLFIIDKQHRKQIAINAGSFALLLLFAKYMISASAPKVAALIVQEEYGFLDKFNWDYIVEILKRISNLPKYLLLYTYECFQNSFLWFFCLLGMVLSVKKRTAWPLYGVVIFYWFANVVRFSDIPLQPYSYFFSLIDGMKAESEYFIVKAFNKFDSRLGHGRYRLVMYPALAFFVIQGFYQVVYLPTRYVAKKARLSLLPIAIVCLTAGIVWYNLMVSYRPIARQYDMELKLSKMHPVLKMGLELRKREATGAVFIDNFCDETDGSVLTIFSAYSGLDTVLTRFCKYGIWVRDDNVRRKLISNDEYKEMMPDNPQLLAMYTGATADLPKLLDREYIRRLESIAFAYNDSLMQEENVNHVLAARKISVPNLAVVDSVKGGGYIHRRKVAE